MLTGCEEKTPRSIFCRQFVRADSRIEILLEFWLAVGFVTIASGRGGVT